MLLPAAHREMQESISNEFLGTRDLDSMSMEVFLDEDYIGCCACLQGLGATRCMCNRSGKEGLDSAPNRSQTLSPHHTKKNGSFRGRSITAQQLPE